MPEIWDLAIASLENVIADLTERIRSGPPEIRSALQAQLDRQKKDLAWTRVQAGRKSEREDE